MVKMAFFNAPKVLGMSLIRGCNASCIWCPIGRKLYHKPAVMKMETVDNLVEGFKGVGLEEIWFGENGEALLHPRFKEIVSRFREAYPRQNFGVNSNLNLLTEEKARFLLEKKFWWFGFNLDGVTQEGYGAVKGMPLDVAKSNLERFVQLRDEISPETTIHCSILTQPAYYNAIGEPEKITVRDETIETFKYLRSLLDWGARDTILNPFVLTWAERERWAKPRSDKDWFCIGAYSLGHKMFVDPDGNNYPCCSDYDSDFTFGNVNEANPLDIWQGGRRKWFLQLWFEKRWRDIGRPCLYCEE